MPSTPPQLQSIVSAYRALKRNCDLRGHDLKIKTSLSNSTSTILQELADNDLLVELYIDGSSVDQADLTLPSQLNRDIEAVVSYPKRQAAGYFVKDISQLLKIGKNQYNDPCHYYIANLNYLSGEDTSEKLIVNFNSTIKFIEILQKTCDHIQEGANKQSLVFLNKNKIEIPINYSQTDLCELNEIDDFLQSSLSDDQGGQRKIIFKNVITELLHNVSTLDRFPYLLKNFSLIKQRCKDNFDLYISNFSFEKLREEVEERKVEYFSKLDGVISDIQNKILAIPLALVLIGGQIKETKSISIQNCIVLLGAIIFVILMSILILNQEQTLNHIRRNINSFSGRFKTKYPTIHSKQNLLFSSLHKRCARQEKILVTIMLIVILVGYLAIGLFDFYTPKYDITLLGYMIKNN